MAVALLQPVGIWFPCLAGVTFTNVNLDASGDKIAAIFQADEAITISRLGVRHGATTGTSPTYRISLQGVAANGTPDGTVLGGGSPASATFSPSSLSWGANTWNWVNLTNTYACTRGEYMAWVVDYSSGTIDASNFSSFTEIFSSIAYMFPYTAKDVTGSWAKAFQFPVFGYGSSGTAYGHPIQTITSQTFNSGSTPDEYAFPFTLPAGWGNTFQVLGVRYPMPMTGSSTFTLRLYDTDGSTVLQNVTVDTDHCATASANPRWGQIWFNEASLSNLSYGSQYRIAFLPDSATNIPLTILDVAAAADLLAWNQSFTMRLDTRTDAGSWTTTDDNSVIPMQLILADITEPTGGGGMLVHPGMTGGMRG